MNKYDEQIAELTAHPGRILNDYVYALGLFKFIDAEGNNHADSGCLIMIKGDEFRAYIKDRFDPALTAEIKADKRIPEDVNDITVEHLPIFKEWQEKIDKLQE